MGNGIDCESLLPAIMQPQNRVSVFVFIGVRNFRPSINAVLWFIGNVWLSAIRNHPESCFVVASMNHVPTILALAKIEGRDATAFVDDTPPYCCQSVFFAPLRIARGIRNSILQPFSCALPVLSTNRGAEGIDYTVGKDILIVDTTGAFGDSIELPTKSRADYQFLKGNAIKMNRRALFRVSAISHAARTFKLSNPLTMPNL